MITSKKVITDTFSPLAGIVWGGSVRGRWCPNGNVTSWRCDVTVGGSMSRGLLWPTCGSATSVPPDPHRRPLTPSHFGLLQSDLRKTLHDRWLPEENNSSLTPPRFGTARIPSLQLICNNDYSLAAVTRSAETFHSCYLHSGDLRERREELSRPGREDRLESKPHPNGHNKFTIELSTYKIHPSLYLIYLL